MGKAYLVLAAVVLLCSIPTAGGADDEKLNGVIVGRTGEILHISVPQPVKNGTVFEVRPLPSEGPVAEACVLSCTQERPYIALARVTRGDIVTQVPTGVHAFADTDSVDGSKAPRPLRNGGSGNSDRFSIQTGAFYPHKAALRDTVADFWQAYRLNYSLLRFRGFETVLSSEYVKGTGEFTSAGGTTERTMEIIPLTVLGKIRPVRMGNTHLFLGAGAGAYYIRSEEQTGGTLTSDTDEEFGQEYAIGLESGRGWILELRYRDIENTDISGFSLGIGGRF